MNDSREQQVQQQLSDPDFHPSPNDLLAPDSINTSALYGDDWCGWEAGYFYSEEEMAKVKSMVDIDTDLIASRVREHYADPVKRKAYAEAFLKFANEHGAYSDKQILAEVDSLKDDIDGFNITTRRGLDTITDAFWVNQVRKEGLVRASLIAHARANVGTDEYPYMVRGYELSDEMKSWALTYTRDGRAAAKIKDLIVNELLAKGYLTEVDTDAAALYFSMDMAAIDALAEVAA